MKKRENPLESFRELTKEENMDALKLLLRETAYLLRHSRFRSVKGEMEIGIEDPYLMGQILSALSFLYPLYGKNQELSITPYFDRKELSGEIKIKGHLRLIHVVKAMIRLLMNKRIRSMIFGSRRKERS